MSFLYPGFLWGFLSLGIPLVIHLFNFRRTQQVPFTNVRFLRSVQISTNSFRRLKQWLILLTRLLFLGCLVLAFAQPFVNQQQIARPGAITSLYLDNSLSMQQTIGEQAGLDLAVSQMEQLLSRLPASGQYQLLTNDFSSREQVLSNRDNIRDRVTELRFSNTYRTAESIHQRQQSLLKRQGLLGGNQLFWISDFQKSTLGDLSRLRLDSSNRYFLIPIQAPQKANVYVDSVWLEVPFVRQLESNTLHVRLVNTGDESLSDRSVKLFLDKRQVSTAAFAIEARSKTVVSINFNVEEKGTKKGRIVLSDEPITFDNEYFFILEAAPVIEIVHLYGEKSQPYIENVFSNKRLFSLNSRLASATDPSVVNTADLVVLDEVNAPSQSLLAGLREYVRRGGSLAVFPSVGFDLNAYSSLLGSLGIAGAQKALPAGASDQAMEVPDPSNPFFASIFEYGSSKGIVNMPNAKQLLSWNRGGNTLLGFKNGFPFLSLFQAGLGKAYLCAAPLQASYSSFARHALFVPVMYKMAALSKIQGQMAYSFGDQSIVTEVENPEKNQVYHLKQEDFDLIPQQQISERQLAFELPQSGQLSGDKTPGAGYYELTLNGKPQKWLAINYDKRESETSAYTPQELKSLMGTYQNVQVFEVDNGKDFANHYQDQYVGFSLWRYCLLGALAFLLAEVLLIRLL
jgi:hypothetical protein